MRGFVASADRPFSGTFPKSRPSLAPRPSLPRRDSDTTTGQSRLGEANPSPARAFRSDARAASKTNHA
jgi:hypothetical protein